MIKKLLAVFPMLFLSVISYGQLQKGTLMLGGAVGFESSSSSYNQGNVNDSKYNSLTFSPDIGYFVNNQWVIGLNTRLFWSNQTIDSQLDEGRREVTVGPFVRKYFPLGDQLSFFGQLGVGVNNTKLDTEQLGQGANVLLEQTL
jgi:hypothetical protein